MHGVFGFFLRIFGTRRRITQLKNYRGQDIDGTSTAVVFPIYNEDIVRVYEGLRATYESLKKTGRLERFDFFILSDSTDPDKWIEEERRWFDLIRELDALGKIYYRRRLDNEGRKSGNVRDFLNAWGRRYRYFMVCDADSVMRGETLVDLVKLMEAHPTAGLIQTVPATVNAESLFGRIQQFANRLYAPVFIAGLNYWALDLGNYWGTTPSSAPSRSCNSATCRNCPGASRSADKFSRTISSRPRSCRAKTGKSGSPMILKAATKKRRRR
jgi:membrane glycosyltransferase